MNIMLVTVTERTREIGIRKAIGARRTDILAQFLTESVLLSVLGGMLGVAVGLVGSRFKIVGVQPVVELYSVLLALGVGVAVGLFFGIYPANRAALAEADRSASLRIRSDVMTTIESDFVPPEDDDALELLAIRRRRRLPVVTAVLVVALVAAAAFIGGVEIQKHEGGTSAARGTAAPAFSANRLRTPQRCDGRNRSRHGGRCRGRRHDLRHRQRDQGNDALCDRFEREHREGDDVAVLAGDEDDHCDDRAQGRSAR